MILFVSVYEGIILNTQINASPTAYVDDINLKIAATIAPIPEITKCKKMVTVYAIFSLPNMNEVT